MQLSSSATLLWCIAIAAFLIYAPFLLVAYGRVQLGWEALATPRAMVDKLPAFAQRATWAHQNSFEAFALFATAALMGYVTQVDSPLASIAAIAHVVARFFYSIAYILNIVVLRSLTFAIGSLAIAVLMGLSLLQLR